MGLIKWCSSIRTVLYHSPYLLMQLKSNFECTSQMWRIQISRAELCMTPGGEQNVQNIIVHIIQDAINEIHNINTNVTHLSKTNITMLLSK